MLFSQLFTKTRKEAPKDEVAKNAELLIRGGFIHKEMAGVYAYLPLGLRVLSRINTIVREEMNGLGAQEIFLTALQNPELWKKTDRWEQDVWFKTQLKNGVEVGLGWTQEEQIVSLMSREVSSYKDLPLSVYQIQTKFRNEERAKSGILRGREFLMKDMYSFHTSQKSLDDFYEKVKEAYTRIFKRVGIGEKTFFTFAAGGAFAKYSHEFQTICDAGEDTIYVSQEKGIAVNAEVLTDEILGELWLPRKSLQKEKAIEVGNIFKLGTRFSVPLGLFFKDEKGEKKPVVMGCYGLGPSRLMGTIVETLSDEKGIVWPYEVAPFQFHLIELSSSDPRVHDAARGLHEEAQKAGWSVLYDDRQVSTGIKFKDADLIGIPYALVVSEETVRKGIVAELIERENVEKREISALFLPAKWKYPF